MTLVHFELAAEQAQAFDRVKAYFMQAGVDLEQAGVAPAPSHGQTPLAITGKAGSGKTVLLATIARAAKSAGMTLISGDYEPKAQKRSLAILAPTNKAASVLRAKGVPATTIHRILYSPVYDPEFEAIAEWLAGDAAKPNDTDGVGSEALARIETAFNTTGSIPAALAAAGFRGSDFITGWKRRDKTLDMALIDEASMLDQRQYEDLQEIFPNMVMFGDPAQLAPVNQSGKMVFDEMKAEHVLHLSRVHRQAEGNPILDLAHALADPDLSFQSFEDMVEEAAHGDARVVVAERADADMMARSPMLVWRNATRIRLIKAFRVAHGASDDALLEGEPLICDGIELPLKHRRKRLDLEARGLIKGAQVVYLGAGRRAGFARLYVMGAEEPQLSVAAIIKIEQPDDEMPMMMSSAQMGAAFLHAAAVTIHKSQGSQWREVQVYAPDLWAAAQAGRNEAGMPLWKRLAYVAITRAQERLIWVKRNRLARPVQGLAISDLLEDRGTFKLEAQTAEHYGE